MGEEKIVRCKKVEAKKGYQPEYPCEITPVASYFTTKGNSDCICNLCSSLKIPLLYGSVLKAKRKSEKAEHEHLAT